MRRILVFLLVAWSITACQNAEDAEPGNAETYIKLIGSEFQDSPAKLLILTTPTGDDDGVLVLGTIENEPLSSFKIRLTRLDKNGNTSWERTFPQEDSTEVSYRAGSIIAVDNGYFIVGDSIRNEIEDSEEEFEAVSGLLILKVDLDGMIIEGMTRTTALEDAELLGKNVTINQRGELVVISEIVSEDLEEDILITTYDINTLQEICSQQYTGGDVSLSPSLLVDPSSDYVFAGTVAAFGNQTTRIFKVPDNCNANLISGPLLVQDNANDYILGQIIPTINGFAIVGTTNETGIKTDIFMARLDPFGVLQGSIVIYDQLDGKDAIDEEEGLTIANTSDGGFILSGSTRSNTGAGETNIVLIKVDAGGNVQWTNQFGDLNEEEGVFIEQSLDGGYYVLGSTEFGGLDTIIVIRTDSEGNVE